MNFVFRGHHTLKSARADGNAGVHAFEFNTVSGMLSWKYDNQAELLSATVISSTTPIPMVIVTQQGVEPQQTPKEFVIEAINQRFNKAYIDGNQEVQNAMEELRQFFLRWMPTILAMLVLPQIAYSALAGKSIERLDTRGNETIHRIDKFRF